MSAPTNIVQAFATWATQAAAYRSELSKPGNTFPMQADEAAGPRYVVFQVIDDPSHHVMPDQANGVAAVASIRNPLVQVECYGDTVLEAMRIADALENELDGYRGELGGIDVRGVFKRARRMNTVPRNDGSESVRHSVQLDFEVWRAT